MEEQRLTKAEMMEMAAALMEWAIDHGWEIEKVRYDGLTDVLDVNLYINPDSKPKRPTATTLPGIDWDKASDGDFHKVNLDGTVTVKSSGAVTVNSPDWKDASVTHPINATPTEEGA